MHRRFLIWSRAGVWGQLHQNVLQLLDGQDLIDLSRAVLDSAHVRAKKGARLQVRAPWAGVGPDRDARPVGCERTALTRRTLRSQHPRQPRPEADAFPLPYGTRIPCDDSKPQRLHADKAYDVPHLRRWLWGKHIGVRIARKGIESSQRLGRRRWVIERTMSWLTSYRRLNHRYERQPGNYLAFLKLAAALCCYKRLLKLTM